MAKIRNVVKVMNFHSLLRVDAAKKKAEKYFQLEEELTEMIDDIVNNRNFLLDKKALQPKAAAPVLNIYFGSDYGFCASYNSAVTDMIRKDHEGERIILGRKMHKEQERVLLQCSREAYEQDETLLTNVVEEGIRKQKYSAIYIIYNRYNSISDIRLERKQIYPVVLKQADHQRDHNEDFLCEGDVTSLLVELYAQYVDYEITICGINTSAAENILRQNTTRESLKKIDEREEEFIKVERKEKKARAFRKAVENYTKKRMP